MAVDLSMSDDEAALVRDLARAHLRDKQRDVVVVASVWSPSHPNVAQLQLELALARRLAARVGAIPVAA